MPELEGHDAPSTTAAPAGDEHTTRDPTAEPLAIDEVIERYPGEWILLRVTGYDADKLVSHGCVIAHDASHDRIWQIFGEVSAPADTPNMPYYIFSACPGARTGEEARRLLEQAQAEFEGEPFRWPR